MKRLIAVLVFGLCCLSTSYARAADEQCPLMKAAKQAGVQGEPLAKLEKQIDSLVADIQTAFKRDDIKAINAGIETAEASKDKKKAAELEAKLTLTLKPELDRFHKQAKDLLGNDLYTKFNGAVPAEYKKPE